VIETARAVLFPLIESTTWLDWLLLTKRPQHVMTLIPEEWRHGLPANVWLGITAENQRRYDERWPIAASIPARLRFVSNEPALEAITLRSHNGVVPDWVITGGESGGGARPYFINWALSIIDQCRGIGAVPFVKQLGSNAWIEGRGLLEGDPSTLSAQRVRLRHPKGENPSEWHKRLRVQEFPTSPAEVRMQVPRRFRTSTDSPISNSESIRLATEGDAS
jgi:hypothetical protein